MHIPYFSLTEYSLAHSLMHWQTALSARVVGVAGLPVNQVTMP